MGIRNQRPIQIREPGLMLGGAQVSPNDAASLLAGIRRQLDLVLEVAIGRLRRHVYAAAIHIVFPPVVDATQAALFIAAEKERGPPVGAMLLQQTDPAGAVPKRDEVFPQELDPNGRAVRLGQMRG